MKEAVVNKEIKVEIKDVAVPKPGPAEVLIKVVVAGSLSPLLFARQASMMSSHSNPR
jgi:NADPH:quinone reductase-like Zn-dependent oxidoreductase